MSNPKEPINGQASQTLQITGQATARVRMNFSIPHLLAASMFARRAFAVETENHGQPLGPFFDEIMSYASAAVLSSVAGVESYINELFVNELHIDTARYLENQDSELLSKMWFDLERKDVLDKCDWFLYLRNKSCLRKGVKTYQDMADLIKVRNVLIHFKPEWQDEEKEHMKIGKKLLGKFAPSPFISQSAGFFPQRCMSHGLAEWSVNSASNFIQSFSHEAKLHDLIAQFKHRLETR